MERNRSPLTGYEPRTYRHRLLDDDFVSFQVQVKETDLWIKARKDLADEARDLIIRYRYQIEQYISLHPEFFHSLTPLPEDPWAPPIIQAMLQAAQEAGVGPMAAVAGAIAEFIGKDLLRKSPEVIVENGGDLFLSTRQAIKVGIFAGRSPFSFRLALQIPSRKEGWGLCTSSGTVGPSLSLGIADAVCVLSPSASLADAAATAIGNWVKTPGDILEGIERAQTIRDLSGVLIICGEKLGVWGEMELISLEGER